VAASKDGMVWLPDIETLKPCRRTPEISENAVGRFGNPKRRFGEVGLLVARRMICSHH
jgi:hypothetical protein